MKSKMLAVCLLALLVVPTPAHAAKTKPILITDISFSIGGIDYATLNNGDIGLALHLKGTGTIDCLDNASCVKVGLDGTGVDIEQEILMKLGTVADGLFDGKAGTQGSLTIGNASVVFQGKGITEVGGCTTGIHQFMAMITEVGGCTTGIHQFYAMITEAGGCTTGIDQFMALVQKADICATGLVEFMAMITEAGGCTTWIDQFMANLSKFGGCAAGLEEYVAMISEAGGCTTGIDQFISRITEVGGCTTGIHQFMDVDFKLHTKKNKKLTETLTGVFDDDTGTLLGFWGEIIIDIDHTSAGFMAD